MNARPRDNRLMWVPRTGLFFGWAATRVGLLFALSRLGDSGDAVMPLTFSWVEEILAGESPYHERGIAYPPLAMFLFALIGAGTDHPGAFAARFATAVLVIDFAGLCMAAKADRQGRRYAGPAYVLGMACAGPILLLWRYDVFPAVCHLAAGLCLLRGYRRLSWASLGVGIAAKPYLLVVLPVWVVWELKSSNLSPRRRAAEGLIFAIGPSLAAAVAMLGLSGFDFVSAYTFQASRGLQIESGPAVLLAELARAGVSFQKPLFSAACLCWERTGPAAGTVSAFSTFLGAACLSLIVVLVWRRATTQAVLNEKVLLGSCAAVVITLVTFRVFSPQYLVWALAPLSVVAGSRTGATAAFSVGGAALAAAYLYPFHYEEVIQHSGAGRWLLIARSALLLVAFVCLVPSKRATHLIRR